MTDLPPDLPPALPVERRDAIVDGHVGPDRPWWRERSSWLALALVLGLIAGVALYTLTVSHQARHDANAPCGASDRRAACLAAAANGAAIAQANSRLKSAGLPQVPTPHAVPTPTMTFTLAVVGPVGPEGSPGPSGAAGSSGPRGPAGPVGSGHAGVNGAPGSPGPSGQPGPTGPSGPSGPVGASGATGPDGPTGATGPAGPDGTNGRDGAPPVSWTETFVYTDALGGEHTINATCTRTVPFDADAPTYTCS